MFKLYMILKLIMLPKNMFPEYVVAKKTALHVHISKNNTDHRNL